MRLAIPLYVHPAVDLRSWDAVVAHASEIDWVVVNAADGPGTFPDGVLGAGIDRVQEAGIQVLGYLDGAYGRRSAVELTDDLGRWDAWYGVRGAFVDRTPESEPGWVSGTVHVLRSAGASRVVGNPGLVVNEETASQFDDLVVFEGTAAAHRLEGDAGQGLLGDHTTCHLVYGVPAEHVADTIQRAHRAGAATVWVTGRAGQNPYLGVPGYVADVIEAIRTVGAGDPAAGEAPQQGRL
jgi:hypothetical protein